VAAPPAHGSAARRSYADGVNASFDLRRLRLRPGEVRREHVDVLLDPFLLGGQRYEARPAGVTAELELAQPSGAMLLDLRAHVLLAGPCMRCLADAEVKVDVAAREFHDPDAPPGDELRSDYVVDEHLQVGAWLRDAVALEIPDRILCRPDCAGLCPVCGKDLNVEPHEHEDTEPDPRWAALAPLRDDG
jgi:uncharacterized protein